MNALKTTFVGSASATLKDIEDALAEARKEGAPDHANVFTILGGAGPVFKVEWSDEEPDHAGPPADTREQPVQAGPSFATGGVVGVPVILHAGEALVQPDEIVNEPGN